MPPHAIAEHLRRIAARLEQGLESECQAVERLADGFDALVTGDLNPDEWSAERDRLLAAVRKTAIHFERRIDKTSYDMVMAMRELASVIYTLQKGK